jgi:signal transduction histidine kinase
MGLGIFLVRTLADRLGGRLRFDSTVGVGTTAVLELPLASHAVTSKLETELVV